MPLRRTPELADGPPTKKIPCTSPYAHAARRNVPPTATAKAKAKEVRPKVALAATLRITVSVDLTKVNTLPLPTKHPARLWLFFRLRPRHLLRMS